MSQLTKPEDLFSLTQRVAIVLGVGGLGSMAAYGLAGAGAEVAACDIDLNKAQQCAAVVRDEGGFAKAYHVDVDDEESVTDLAERTESELGPAGVVIVGAARTFLSDAESFPTDKWEEVIRTNLTGTFHCCRVFGRQMIRNGGGSMVLFSSISGVVGLERTLAYAASKGGVTQMVRSLALEWAAKGVRVNGIAPSFFDTDLVRNAAKGADAALFQKRIQDVPLKRFGAPEEIVGAVQFLASDASSMVTGAILPVDGGYLAR